MIRCHLSRLTGQRKLRVADVVRATGLPRSTVTALWKDTATRIDIATLDILCKYLDCTLCELLEYYQDRFHDAATEDDKKPMVSSMPLWYMNK